MGVSSVSVAHERGQDGPTVVSQSCWDGNRRLPLSTTSASRCCFPEVSDIGVKDGASVEQANARHRSEHRVTRRADCEDRVLNGWLRSGSWPQSDQIRVLLGRPGTASITILNSLDVCVLCPAREGAGQTTDGFQPFYPFPQSSSSKSSSSAGSNSPSSSSSTSASIDLAAVSLPSNVSRIAW
jgi:hypothetical protein